MAGLLKLTAQVASIRKGGGCCQSEAESAEGASEASGNSASESGTSIASSSSRCSGSKTLFEKLGLDAAAVTSALSAKLAAKIAKLHGNAHAGDAGAGDASLARGRHRH